MKKIILLTTLIASFGANTAYAGEYSEGMFDGFKVGLEAGLHSNSAKIKVPGDVVLKKTKKGLGLRAFAGYDMQMSDSFVLGGELGLGLGSPTTKAQKDKASFKVEQGLTLDASARAGMLVSEGMLVYGRVGYTSSKIKATYDNTALTGAGITVEKRRGGLLLGVGTEFAISDSFGVRLEYRRAKHGKYKSNQLMAGGVMRF